MRSSYRLTQFLPEDSRPAPLKTRLLIWAVIFAFIGAVLLMLTYLSPLFYELFNFAPDISAYKKTQTYAQMQAEYPKEVRRLDRHPSDGGAPVEAVLMQDKIDEFLLLIRDEEFRYGWYSPSGERSYTMNANTVLFYDAPNEIPAEAYLHVGDTVNCGIDSIGIGDDYIVVTMYLFDNTNGDFSDEDVSMMWYTMRVGYISCDRELCRKANEIFRETALAEDAAA